MWDVGVGLRSSCPERWALYTQNPLSNPFARNMYQLKMASPSKKQPRKFHWISRSGLLHREYPCRKERIGHLTWDKHIPQSQNVVMCETGLACSSFPFFVLVHHFYQVTLFSAQGSVIMCAPWEARFLSSLVEVLLGTLPKIPPLGYLLLQMHSDYVCLCNWRGWSAFCFPSGSEERHVGTEK